MSRPGRPSKDYRPSRALGYAVLLLLLVGAVSSMYLLHLYLEVHAGDAAAVDSFCDISEGVSCVTVAASPYSAFLGLPVALYGLEFFVLAAVVVAASMGRWRRLHRWDSLLLWATGLAVPACAVLGWVSVTAIQSVCVLCLTVYAAVGAVFLALLLTKREPLGALLRAGPAELGRLCKGRAGAAGVGLLSAVLLSQFLWVPSLVHDSGHTAEASGAPHPEVWHGLPTDGLAIGPADAPVTIEEFTDFQCPYCSKAHTTMLRVVQQYAGKIRLIHRDFPLDDSCHPNINRPFHPHACQAAFFARCAAEQGRFWPYDAILFHNQDSLDRDGLKRLARKAGLDVSQLEACADRPATREAVLADIREGLKRNIQGTPTLFVNGERIVGYRPLEFWHEKIESIVAGR